jgi:hypothetical protein
MFLALGWAGIIFRPWNPVELGFHVILITIKFSSYILANQ